MAVGHGHIAAYNTAGFETKRSATLDPLIRVCAKVFLKDYDLFDVQVDSKKII